MTDSLKFKFLGRSKSRKKESKYIPAAIIPTAAFVANPTKPTTTQIIDNNSNKLLNNTLSSSLVGLSAEYRKHQLHEPGNNKEIKNFDRRSHSLDGKKLYDEDIINSDYTLPKKQKRKNKSENDNDSKRSIPIANGLFENDSPTKESRRYHIKEELENHNAASCSNSFVNKDNNSFHAIDYHNNDLKFVSENIEFIDTDKDLSYSTDMNGTMSVVLNDKEYDKKTILLGFEHLYGIDEVDNLSGIPKINNNSILPSSGTSEVLLTAPTNFKNSSPPNKNESMHLVNPQSSRSAQTRTPRHEGDDQNVRQLKDEIRALQDINYRLNIEVSNLLPDIESGRLIGKSVFPGKGPVPNWIMNTKYLTPLLAVYDRKFQEQNFHIQKIQGSLVQFEKEVHQVMNENKQLYSQLQENKRSGPSNEREWLLIIDQTKLVIEENQLLLQELGVQQERNKELERKYITDVAQLKTALSTVTSERDLSNKEVFNLLAKISEMKDSPIIVSTTSDTSSEVNLLKCQIDDLRRNNNALEADFSDLRDIEKKNKKKIEKLKSMLKSEKEFRQYLSEIIDKGNEISNERDALAEMLKLRDSEITRINNKLINTIKYNFDIGIDGSNGLSKRKTDDVSLEPLYTLETWVSALVHFAEDLNSRCKHQEKDVHYYQNVLKEKDLILQEREKSNEELESKLDLLWQNATRDS